VTIQGATISFADPNAPAIRVQNNPGAVRLSEVDVTRTGHMFTATIQAIVEVENTATFWMIDSSVWSDSALFANTSSTRTANGLANDGVSAIQLIDSGGMLQNSKFRGYHNDLNGLGNNGCGGDAVRAIGENTSIWLLEDNVSPGSPGFLAQFIAGSGNFGGHCVHQFRSVFAAGKITSCGGDDDQISLNMGPGARLHPGQGALGGVYAWNNDNNVTPSNPPGQVAFKMVKHCIENERRNETTLVSNVASIGGNLDIRLRTRLDRRYLVVCSFVTEYTFSTPGFTGRAMAGPDFSTIAGTSTGQVISPLTVAIPSLSNLIGKQVVVQSVFGPPGGVNFDNIGLPALAVIGP
jgi:hypothetical protein